MTVPRQGDLPAVPPTGERAPGEPYIRLLVLQLTAAIDELQEGAPDAAADSPFQPAWETITELPGPLLRRAIEEPAMEEWITRLRTLLVSSAFEACPQHHLPRILARFSALLLNLAGQPGLPVPQGEVAVVGTGTVPLHLGTAQLRPPDPRRSRLRWMWDGELHIHERDGTLVVHADTWNRTTLHTDRGWRIEWAQHVDGVPLFSKPPCIAGPASDETTSFVRSVRQAWRALPQAPRELIRDCIGAIVPASPQPELVATRWLGLPERPVPRDLTRALAISLIGQLDALHRFNAGAGLREAVGADSGEELMDRLVAELLEDAVSESGSFLHQLMDLRDTGGGPTAPPPSSAPRLAPPRPGLDFAPLADRAGIPVGRPNAWLQPKGHDRSKSPCWQLLDAFLSLPRSQLEALRTACAHEVHPELRHFGLACLDYFEGRFIPALSHLAACLEIDGRCEEYWLLLAFTLRHQHDFDTFDDIAFTGSRDGVILERIGEQQ